MWSKKKWELIYSLPHLCTANNEVKELQFKILHRYVATNKLLYSMNKVDTPRCTFCNIQIETLYHLFFECTILKCIWHHISVVCSRLCDTVIHLTLSVRFLQERCHVYRYY